MGKFVDLTGQTFGELTVVERDKEKPRYWICRCSCGKEKSIQGYSLTNGLTKTCGHSTTGFKDITGQQFNEWTALKYKGKGYWECRCSCGKIKDVQKYYLENNISRSCGHDKEEHYQDLIGKTFGKLTVLRYIGNKQYICKCICGNESVVFKHNLISGGTSSCGCSRGISKDEILEAAKCFEESNGIKPFTDELASILEVSETHLSKLIIKYEIKEAINNKFSSKYEKLVYDWVKESVNIDEIILHDRKLLDGIELDIYIPSKKLAIEINGDYWHSSNSKYETYHQEKSLKCLLKDVQLIHIFEHELIDEQSKMNIKSLINNRITFIGGLNILNDNRKEVILNLDKENVLPYINNGYKIKEILKPDYIYVSQDKKHITINKEDISENNYYKIYDSGKIHLYKDTFVDTGVNGRKAEDITGQKFNKLTAIEYIGDSIWKCQCDCGEYRDVRITYLRNGRIKACEKCAKKASLKKDLTGQTFNEWTVKEYVGDSYWLCKCSCGKEKEVKAYDLTSGKSKSCGHNDKGPKFVDLTGQTFNKWTVLKYAGDRQWLCRCSCGKEKLVWGKFLKSGQSKSCGHAELFDRIGEKFGKLTLLSNVKDDEWLLECECGKTTIANASNLLRGSTKSCGCESASNPLYTREEMIKTLKLLNSELGRKPFTEEFKEKLGVTIGTAYKYIRENDLDIYINREASSIIERDIASIIKEDYITRDKKVLYGKELDIYIPSKKTAIEVNGDYWHCELYKDTTDHQHKTLECIRQNIHLIHIFEHELKCKEQQIKNYIKNKINDDYIEIKSSKIKVITKEDANTFLSAESISSYTTNAHINIGCFKDNTLIGVLTANIDNNICKIENICWKTNIRVMNGTDKLINYLISGLSNIEKLEFKTDITKFTSRSLLKYGFNIVCIGSPNYKWYTPYSKEDNIICKEDAINKDMYSIGYIKIFDSGTMDLVYSIKK